jgi:hypothetical protein
MAPGCCFEPPKQLLLRLGALLFPVSPNPQLQFFPSKKQVPNLFPSRQSRLIFKLERKLFPPKWPLNDRKVLACLGATLFVLYSFDSSGAYDTPIQDFPEALLLPFPHVIQTDNVPAHVRCQHGNRGPNLMNAKFLTPGSSALNAIPHCEFQVALTPLVLIGM